MSALGLTIVSIIGGMVAGLLALLIVLLIFPKPRRGAPPPQLPSAADPRQFLFRNGYLVEHSDNVAFLLPLPVDHLKAWDQLLDTLSEVADGVGQAFTDLLDHGRSFRIEGAFGPDRVHVIGVRAGQDLRITVVPLGTAQDSLRVDVETLRLLEKDVELLNHSADTSPALSWTLDTEGRVTWANAAYVALVKTCLGKDAGRGWPIATLFSDPGNGLPVTSRRQVTDLSGAVHWFEVTTRAPDSEGMRHMHALSIDAVIAAEDSLRSFIQTLAKTFAHLPTGLAIFDRDRTLAMFNPALMDMTGLDGAWLSRRPQLEDFFNALRDHSKLPEPRDYKRWRDGLSDLSRVDEGGTYTETWTLPSGETYCVTGRPQADGAVALMLEDISADISASQIQRREREALLGGIAELDSAILMFGPDGTRLAASARAAALLDHLCPGTDLPETLEAALTQWARAFLPTPSWGDIRSMMTGAVPEAERTEWTETLRPDADTTITLRVVPLRGGGVTLIFGDPVAGTLPQPEAVRIIEAEPVD